MIIFRAKASPFEVMFMIAAILGGLALLVLRHQIRSGLTLTLPAPTTIMLGAGLIAGGAIVLTGVGMHSMLGTLFERAGLAGLAVMFVVYAGFTLTFTGLRGLITVLFFLSFAIASVWRIRQIFSDVRDAEKAIKSAMADRSRGGVE